MWWGAFCKRHQVLSFAHGGTLSGTQPVVLRLAAAACEAMARAASVGARARNGSKQAVARRHRAWRAAASWRRRGTRGPKRRRRAGRAHARARARARPSARAGGAGRPRRSIRPSRLSWSKHASEHATAQAKAAEAGRARKAALTDRKVALVRGARKQGSSVCREEKSQRQRAAELERRHGSSAGERSRASGTR